MHPARTVKRAVTPKTINVPGVRCTRSRLSAIAQRAGTVGKRTQAIQTYEAKKRADQEAHRQWQEEIHTVGSPTWTREARRYYSAAVIGPGFSALRQCWHGDGLTDLDLVTYLVEQDVAAQTTVQDWDINTTDVKDAAPPQGVGGVSGRSPLRRGVRPSGLASIQATSA